jgi:hypothetical protein
MKRLFLFGFLMSVFVFSSHAQPGNELPEFQLQKSELEAHLRFLASDALQGRRTTEIGNDIAASYIAANMEAFGIKKAPGMDSYFQYIPFKAVTPPSKAELTLGKAAFQQGEDLMVLSGNSPELKTEAIFVAHGWVDEEKGHDDYKGLDVVGKLVVTLPGTPDSEDPLTVFKSMRKKMQIAQEKGAVAVIELYRLPFPWEFFKLFFNKENLVVADQENKEDNSIVYGWIKEKEEDDTIKNLQDGKKVKSQIASSGFIEKDCRSQNVIGVIEGTDPVLKEEYIIITAHYDHVGTGKNGGGAYSPEDSIFNGARDNAMGTVALMAAAKSLALQPIKRSVIILAVTGEELGLLGSQYYAEHPIIPLEKTIFNLNTDGAGYNDVSYVSVVGYGRTGTDELIDASANVFGLEVFPNPAPEQNLFDRSDNVSFAQKGVPAVCFSPGMTSFDDTVAKYYHQVADNPDTIDFDYLHKFCQSLARAARLIGDREELPQWKAGDKYEEAGKSLYNE